ncbi:MAG: M20 family metallopeptidase [Planctomycetia bacterium]|nr:M20 family metallopeptidase [Planctomycetia bacterium]
MDLVKTLSDLVALASVNPMGRAVSGPEYLEYRVTDYLEQLFKKLALPYQRQTVEPKRDNIVARVDGEVPPSEGGPLVLFEAHQDTVPVVGMTIEPWTPTVRDGRLYGRGACDIKGGLTAMLGAVARLAQERPPGMPTIVMACSVNEEHGYSGATALTRLWSQPGSIIARQPDAAIVAEPTELQVVVAHKGVVRWRCHAHGRAAHSSQPHLGVNAIFKMSRLLNSLERYQSEAVSRLGQHALCGQPTLSVGTISGGLSVNTVPDGCTIEIDRRLIPGEKPAEAYRHVLDFIESEIGADPAIEHEPPFLIGVGLSDEANGPLAERMVAAAREARIPCDKVGVPYGTNAAAIGAAGVPSIVFGPGSIDQAHTADEWLALDQLARASEALYRFGRTGLK